MSRSSPTAVVLLLALSSSLAAAMGLRHIAWDGMVQGKNGSKIRGLIEMVGGTAKGTTSAEVQYTGDTPAATRAWHVHTGSCSKAGAILGGAAAYPALKVDAKGATKAKTTLRVPLPESGSYYIDVHDAPGNLGKVVACGDLLLAE
jgi:superoxide dismutase, Cu-Zn family